MKVKWGLIVILVSVLALPAAEGCQEKRPQVLEIPPPLPRYLSREHEDAKPAESEAPAEAAPQEQAESPDQPARTPEEVAAQIRDLATTATSGSRWKFP